MITSNIQYNARHYRIKVKLKLIPTLSCVMLCVKLLPKKSNYSDRNVDTLYHQIIIRNTFLLSLM